MAQQNYRYITTARNDFCGFYMVNMTSCVSHFSHANLKVTKAIVIITHVAAANYTDHGYGIDQTKNNNRTHIVSLFKNMSSSSLECTLSSLSTSV